MIRNCFTILVLCLFNGTGYSQELLSNTNNIKVDFTALVAKKIRVQSNDPLLLPAYKQLLKDANKLLNYKPVSVMEKTALPPSGNKHDYMSLAPYWWPDSSKTNGLPYIRRDGVTNPEVKNYPDKNNMPKLCENVNLLALAYYFSGDEKYAKHASKLTEVWFLDTATRMNPNLNYAQAIKGTNEGRGAGVIDTRHFIFLIDGIKLLNGSKYWTAQDQSSLKKWFSDYLLWMQTSKVGKDEMSAKNNHGVWFDAQSLTYALFIDSTNLANKIVTRAAKRLDVQVNDSGFFPLELERTTSLHYSVFAMNPFYIIASQSETLNTNFWTLVTKSGKSLQKCFNVIYPYIAKEKEWTGQQIKPYDYSDGFSILLRSSEKYNCKPCLGAIKKILGERGDTSLVNLL